jgi:hypothetical protein
MDIMIWTSGKTDSSINPKTQKKKKKKENMKKEIHMVS